MTTKIVAIGGGELRQQETFQIDQQIVQLTEKVKPKALFIPTASSDSTEYFDSFKQVYGDKLNCETDVLYLLNENISEAEIKDKISSADLIYVGGGNTLMMMRKWRFTKADKWLRKASAEGTVMAGLSAGAMCWFDFGHSDSMSFYTETEANKDWDYIRVKCLGLVDKITLSVHFDLGDRRESLQQLIKGKGGIGIGLPDLVSMEIVGDSYRLTSLRDDAKAYRYYKSGSKIREEVLTPSSEFTSIYRLLYKGQ